MNHTPVNSSNVESVRYDPAAQRLEVKFKNGGVYAYADVPQSEYDDLM